MEKTRIRLNICGVEIIVSGDADRQDAEKIADIVRNRMQRILSTAYAASTDKAAVITAMNLCEELEAANGRIAELEKALAETKEAEFDNEDVDRQTLIDYNRMTGCRCNDLGEFISYRS